MDKDPFNKPPYGNASNQEQTEQRYEKRYPCVGINLLYSPTSNNYVNGLAEELFKASVKDMSLSGLAFDVDRPLQKNEQLVVLIRQPNQDASARLMAQVRWCQELSAEHYRVGIHIDQDEAVSIDKPGIHISEPVGKNASPHTLEMDCPACEQQVNFYFVGEQPVLKGKGIMPLYNCPACGTTRSLTGILLKKS